MFAARCAIACWVITCCGIAGSAHAQPPPADPPDPTDAAPAPVQPPPPSADITQQCVDAHLATQQLRKANKLSAAKEQILICVQEGCPPPIKSDCGGWLNGLDAQIPRIVVIAKDVDGKDTADVRLSIDGVKVSDRLDGTPVSLDPGPHEIKCEHAGASYVEKVVVVHSVKSRPVTCSFAADAPPPPPPEGAGQPIAGYVLGALSLGAFATFAALGIIGTGEADDLQAGCGQTDTCTDAEIDPVRTKLIVADVALVTGVALLAVSLGLIIHHFATEPDEPTAALRFDVLPTPGDGPLPGGALGQLTVQF